jgi:hypothetical protein
MPEQWTKSIIVHIYMNGGTTDCNNYTGTSLLFLNNYTTPNG